MATFGILLYLLVAISRLIVALWNASVVLLQVVRSVIQEAKQEAAELVALLDEGGPTLDAATSTSLVHGTGNPENPWQMLIIARASSFVLLVRVSKHRVLHLEVDERFITGKLEVIRTELMLHIEHVPRLLEMPIGMHDTRLMRYTPMRLPYLWKERGEMTVERSIIPVGPASSVSVGGEGRSHRKKYVQLLTERALRRRLRMDILESEAAAKRGMGVVKRKALGNATNATDGGMDEGVAESAAKEVRMERRTMSENSRMGKGSSLRRKRGHSNLYAQGVSSEFSLLAKKE